MKVRLVKLTPESLVRAFKGESPSSLPNLPSDVELVDIKYDSFSKQVMAILRSAKFEDVAENYPIPEFNVPSEARSKVGTLPSERAVVKTEPKPIVQVKSQPRQDTGGIEEEFTPEQRKLLSFTADGEYVLVKPTQFLKAEWEEINDVVKSLGGRWVKGDIISYWLVPLYQS